MSCGEFPDRLLDIASGHERIMVVGGVDTGKSTLIKNLADYSGACVLDADIGQNDIGPPSVISLGKRVDGRYHPIDGYFCGSSTPSRHFLQILAGISRLLPSRRRGTILINTSGLATGVIGRALKTEKINACRPDLILGLTTGDELNYLYAFANIDCEVFLFPPHPQVTSRSKAQRAEARRAAFHTHFTGAELATHRLDTIGVERLLLNNGVPAKMAGLNAIDPDIVHAETADGEAFIVSHCSIADPGAVARYLNVGIIHTLRPADFTGSLVGLLGDNGTLLALGIIDSIDFCSGTIDIFSTARRFTAMQFGSMKLDRTDYSTAGTFAPVTLRP